MKSTISERYASLIGLALMYLWGVAALYWLDWVQSDVFFRQAFGFAGAILASVSGISLFLYIGEISSEVKELRKTNSFNEAEANEWRHQAQVAIAILEKERASNKHSP